jgi:flagella basal body P-ring formation protein FlgA
MNTKSSRATARDLVHPMLVVAVIALLLLSARIMSAQTTSPTPLRPYASHQGKRVAVAMHAIARGTVLGADDFALRDTSIRVIGAMADTTPVSTGWVTRRAYAAGEILRTPGVEAPTAVNANTSVQVEFADKNVSLTVRGVVARNGAIGDRVPVRTEMGQRIEATVVARGRVRIDGGF